MECTELLDEKSCNFAENEPLYSYIHYISVILVSLNLQRFASYFIELITTILYEFLSVSVSLLLFLKLYLPFTFLAAM